MKAISIRQPYASLILWGWKHWESRTWRMPDFLIGEPVVIHASKIALRPEDITTDPDALALIDGIFKRHGIESVRDLPTGAGLGVVTLARCEPASLIVPMLSWQEKVFADPDALWYTELVDVVPFPEPVPAKGRLMFWQWTEPIPKEVSK